MNYKNYVNYWYRNGYFSVKSSKDFLTKFDKSCNRYKDRYFNYHYWNNQLRKDLRAYETEVCILVGVFSRLKNTNNLNL